MTRRRLRMQWGFSIIFVLLTAVVSTSAQAISSFKVYLPFVQGPPTPSPWSVTGNMTTPRAGHTATLLPNGNVLVAGGTSDTSVAAALTSAEVYDPATGVWTATGNMGTARIRHTATLLPNGNVLVAGGGCLRSCLSLASAEVYDPNKVPRP